MTDASETPIKVKPKKRGRPSKGGPDPLVGFRAPPEFIARLDAVTEPDESRTDVIKLAVVKEVKRRERKPKSGGQ
jgi:hypothetical protein